MFDVIVTLIIGIFMIFVWSTCTTMATDWPFYVLIVIVSFALVAHDSHKKNKK